MFHWASRLVVPIVMVTGCLAGRVHGDDPAGTDQTARPTLSAERFDKSVARILGSRCLSCHSDGEKKGGLNLSRSATALAGGESGVAIVPGEPASSLLWSRIVDEEMPPDEPLPDHEREILKSWIRSGAPWGTDPIDPFRYSSEARAGYDWWSLQPVVRLTPPVEHGRTWARSAIDLFVAARLQANDLHPSPEADRRALIRRLSFDLLGLPPTPVDVAAFIADESPSAYADLVDRMLCSPAYGERWARHWLDIVRFGESQGFERDKLRPHSWRYRDWVVDAFNSDMPYSEFAQMQLAGDAIAPGNPSAIIASGFLVAGPYDEVGQQQQSAAMKAVVLQDELEDIVSAYGQTFLGLTVNCARCHDHKFDPVRQKEYYRLTAAFAGVRHGERSVGNAGLWADESERIAALQSRVDSLETQIASIEKPARREILAKRAMQEPVQIPLPEPIAQWTFVDNLQDRFGSLNGTAQHAAELQDGFLHVDGKTGYVSTSPIQQDLMEKTLEAWVRLDDVRQSGGGVISIQTLDGNAFDAIVFGEKEPGCWMAGSNGFVRTRSFRGPKESEALQQTVHVAIAYHADGTIACYRNGQPYGKPYKSTGPIRFRAGEANVLFGLRHHPAVGNRFLSGAIERANLYDRALSAAKIATSAGVPYEGIDAKELVARLSEEQRVARSRLKFEMNQLKRQQAILEDAKTYAVVPKSPAATHLLNRGNPMQKEELLTAGAVASVSGVDAEFGLPHDAPEAARRIRLAEWTTHADNPLFARVIVNRVWQYHFGQGLVAMPSDLGFSGGKPSHPELLDRLASELVRNRWSLKSLHREIVMSATYRQSSRFRSDAASVDAQNRWLWRKNPQRLDAEIIRDSMLALSGRLNREMGGPGYRDFTTFVRNTQFYVPKDAIGRTFERRSLYRTWIRSGRNRFLDVFDCPDPSTKTPKRAVTTTPLQALALLNNSFVLRMADRFADQLQGESSDVDRQIVRAFELTYNRQPRARELDTTRQFVATHGLAAFCRVLFNSNEFLYVD